MSVASISAVQARVQELRAMVAPTSTAVTRTDATSASLAVASATTAASTTSAIGSTIAATGTAAGTAGADFQSALAAASSATATTPVQSVASGSDVTAQDLVATAKKYLGVPYVWGGESLSEGGLDCSGLVLRSLSDLGVHGIPRTARQQMHLGTEVPSMSAAKPGDLLVFNGGTHIAIYLGDGKMIDAPKPGKHVNIRDVYAEPTAIRRILPQAAEATQAADATAVPAATTGTDTSRLAWDLLAGAAA